MKEKDPKDCIEYILQHYHNITHIVSEDADKRIFFTDRSSLLFFTMTFKYLVDALPCESFLHSQKCYMVNMNYVLYYWYHGRGIELGLGKKIVVQVGAHFVPKLLLLLNDYPNIIWLYSEYYVPLTK